MTNLDEQYDAALDLLRRVSPRDITTNLNLLCQNNQDLAEDLLSSVDQPLTLRRDTSGKQFLCCDYNRDGDSYRSPFTNEFVPPLDDSVPLAKHLRLLEELANDVFDTYRELYYEGGHSSCYFWEQEDDIAGVVLFQKYCKSSKWDSIHVFEIINDSKSLYTYRLTSSVMLEIGRVQDSKKSTNLCGSLTRQLERKLSIKQQDDHVANVGMLVEEMENRLRSLLHEVYFGKTRDIVGDIRSIESLKEVEDAKVRNKALVDSYSSRSETHE